MMILLVMVKNINFFYIFILIVLYCLLQTLYEVSPDEIIKGKLITEVIILRQENDRKIWFIRSCPFLTPVTGIKIDSTAELSDRSVIIAFKEKITTTQS